MSVTEKAATISTKAAVKSINGVPRLIINGKVMSGNMVFLNGDRLSSSRDVYVSEMNYIKQAGIHQYSVNTNLCFSTAEGSVEQACERLDALLDNDPQAEFLLRVSTVQGAGEDVGPEELITYADGRTTRIVSLASERWIDQAKKEITKLVQHIRTSERYAGRVFGYHLEWLEWMQPDFVTSPDCSKTNSRQFRFWLLQKYGNDRALQAAWGTEDTLDTATVPTDFPIDVPEKAWLLKKDEQKYIDYLDYIGELTASRIEDLAKLIKELTENDSVVFSFYGYYFEIYNATSGHFAMRKLLYSPYLDGFVGPTSYMDRRRGASPAVATSGYMSAADTIARAGKLWVMESDQRTYINRTERDNDKHYMLLQSIDEIMTVHKREIGIAMVHGTAMYPMDLAGLGWYDDVAIWTHFAALNQMCTVYHDTRKQASHFDVALVVDESAQSVVGCSTLSARELAQMMLNIYRAGVRFALVELNDVLAGRVDDCTMYIFPNPFRLSAKEVNHLCDVLHQEGKTAVFLYGFGQTAAADVKHLTGMEITVDDVVADHVVKVDTEVIPGMEDGITMGTKGISRVTHGATTILGHYSDGTDASAIHEEDGWKVIFSGAAGLSSNSIQALARYAGVPVFCDAGDVLVGNEDLLVFNTSSAGDKTVRFAENTDVYDYFADCWYEGVSQVTFPAMEAGVCKWLFYGSKKEIAARFPRWQGV